MQEAKGKYIHHFYSKETFLLARIKQLIKGIFLKYYYERRKWFQFSNSNIVFDEH